MTPETELARLFRAAADEYAEQLKRTPTPDAPEPMEMERALAALGGDGE